MGMTRREREERRRSPNLDQLEGVPSEDDYYDGHDSLTDDLFDDMYVDDVLFIETDDPFAESAFEDDDEARDAALD